MKQLPDGFLPDGFEVESRELDVRPRNMEVVRDEPMQFTMQGNVALPRNLSNELRAVMDSGNPSVWWGWFHRRKIDSWTKTLVAKVNYVNTLAMAYEVENKVKAQAFRNHHLMEDLRAEHAKHKIELQVKHMEMELAHRLTQAAALQNLPLQTYLARLEMEWQHTFAQRKTEDELATKRKDKEENLRIEREDEHDKAIKHLNVVTKAANDEVQRIISLHAEVAVKLGELLAIEQGDYPDYHKKRLIKNKKAEIRRLEDRIERLEEDDRKAGPKAAPKPETKADSKLPTVLGKVRTGTTEPVPITGDRVE